jgi:hypothetical protein
MKTHSRKVLITSLLCALVAASCGQASPILAAVNTGARPLSAPTSTSNVDEAAKVMAAPAAPGGEAKSGEIINLRKELPGTKWKAVPNVALKGGLVGAISFTEKTVEPGGYKYEALSKSLTMTFTHGAKLSLELSKDGKHLQYPRGEIVYERVTE